MLCSRCGVRSVRCRTTQSGLESISINLSAQKEDESHESKLCNKYNYPQCINLFAFDYLIGISRVICLRSVDEYLLQKSFRNIFTNA